MSLLITVVSCIALVVIGLILIKLYAKLSSGKYEITEDLTGKTVLITGATGGIGRFVTEQMTKHGASVHMLCRNKAKAETVAAEIKLTTGNEKIRVWEVDMSQLLSIRKFVSNYLSEEKQPIDILINNAGVGWLKTRIVTGDGLELTMATNHYGHFLLTNLLLDRLMASKQGRIVNVSSIAHFGSNINVDDCNLQSYNMFSSYNLSKLANILFTNELATRLADLGSVCTVNSLHPGSVDTDLFRHWAWYMQPIYAVCRPFMKNIEEGAQCTLYVALSPELTGKSGKYYWDCGEATTSTQAKDRTVQRELWLRSEELTGLPSTADTYPSLLQSHKHSHSHLR